MKKEKKLKKKKKGSWKSKLLWFIIIAGSFALLRQTAMILLIGMLPTLVVKFVDESDDRLWFKTVFCFNLAGVYPYIIDLAMLHDNSLKAVQDQMADGITWLSAYGAAAAGYIVMTICPIISEFFVRVFNTRRIKRHHNKLVRLNKEWGVGEVP